MGKLWWLAVGTFAGGFGRYFLAGAVSRFTGSGFPYGTLVVNSLGCLVIGMGSALVEYKNLLGPEARVLLMAGFCGAFTTFSTYIFESMSLLKDGEILRAMLNLGGSVLLGCLAFLLGQMLVRAI